MEEEMHQSYSWWFNSNKRSTGSPMLVSSLTELENKTKKMMTLIEVEGDSFKKRVEIYYERRPQLISLMEDLYQSHCLLIERYDWARNQIINTKLTDSPSSSEIVDSIEESLPESGVSDGNCGEVHDKNEVAAMKEEIERLRTENKGLKDELMNKNGGKKNWWMFSVLKFFKLCRRVYMQAL